MNESKELSSLVKKISFLDKLYDIARVVDPVAKKVIDIPTSKVSDINNECYAFWGQGKVCSNCVSVRAFYENDTFIKIEYNGEKVFLITATPLDIEDRRVVVELLKDVTNAGIIEGIGSKNSAEIYALLQRQNEKLLKDELTDVFNRRFINERLPHEIIANDVKEQFLSVIIADIDYFKNVNDTYGHVFGDYVLKLFTEQIKRGIRSGDKDWIARFGGEEFLICLPATNAQQAFDIAERIRKNIEYLKIESKEDEVTITASFGIYTLLNEQLSTEELIDRADKNLYLAKSQGRNRIVSNFLEFKKETLS